MASLPNHITPDDYCKRRVSTSGSSLTFAFHFLGSQKRRAITALYAYCRELDDIVDNGPITEARGRLNGWRSEVEALYRGQPEHPITQALAPHVTCYQLDKAHFLSLIDGMEMDIDGQRYVDLDQLQLYCYRAASVVGLLAAAIFGYRNAATLEYARELGIAMQMTNILRDIAEDCRRDRIYIPLTMLARHGVTEGSLCSGERDDKTSKLLHSFAEMADQHFQSAHTKLPAADRWSQLPGLIMAAIYRSQLHTLQREDYPLFDKERARPGTTTKAWLAFRTLISELR